MAPYSGMMLDILCVYVNMSTRAVFIMCVWCYGVRLNQFLKVKNLQYICQYRQLVCKAIVMLGDSNSLLT